MTDGPGFGIVIDCVDPGSLAPFWSAALDYQVIGSVQNYVLLLPNGRSAPKLLLQRVPEAKVTKNRTHLDIEVSDIEAEATRLEGLGARRLSHGVASEHGSRWVVMRDPEGNEFCVCNGGT